MKKPLILTLTLICLLTQLFAQQKDSHRHELNNQILKEYLGVYISQTAQWAKENQQSDYAVCMLCDSYNNYQTFQLIVITDKMYFSKLQLTSYTDIKGTPVFIQNKASAFFETDYSYTDDVLKQYYIKLSDNKAEMEREQQTYIKEHTMKADSLIFKTPQGDKKLALKDYPPVKISMVDDSDKSRPYNMELTFYGNMLQGSKRYR